MTVVNILAFIGGAFVFSLCFCVVIGFVFKSFKPGDLP